MSLAGFKKQINKANQYVSEKIGGAKGTELDYDFIDMEKRVDAMGRLVDELMARTHELLQPNPATRAKLSAYKSISKLRGTANHSLYPQPEGTLGECMAKYGRELGEDSLFGQGLTESGESYKQLAEIKYAMEDAVKQNFLEPLQHLQNKDIKEVNHHRKKLMGRRLDYDCKKRKDKDAAPNVEDEVRNAEDKFEESKQLAETAMHNLLDNDAEQLVQLSAFIEAELQFHQQSADVLQSLLDSLRRKCDDAASRPRKEHVPKRVTPAHKPDGEKSPNHEFDISDPSSYGKHTIQPSLLSASKDLINNTGGGSNKQQPCCEALYDFEAENEGELGFREGAIIQLLSRIDENWLEGTVNGVTGYFPVNFVKVLVDLPPE